MNPILNTLLSLCVGLGAASFVVAQEAAKPAKADKPVAAEKSAKAEKPVTGCCCQAACTPVVAAAQEPKAKAKGDAAAPVAGQVVAGQVVAGQVAPAKGVVKADAKVGECCDMTPAASPAKGAAKAGECCDTTPATAPAKVPAKPASPGTGI